MNSLVLSGRDVYRSPIVYKSQEIINLKFDLTRESDVFVLVVKEMEDNEADDMLTRTLSTYLHLKGEKFTHFEMDRLPHDLVLGLISTEHPKRLSELLKRTYTIIDNKTPDHLTDKYCFELGTSANGGLYAYETKKNVYSKLCKEHQLKNMVLGVGPMEVASNFDLTDTEVNLICRLYSLGKRIQFRASTLGFIVSRDDGDLERSIRFSLSGEVDKFPESSLHIDHEEWDKWSRHLEKNDFRLENASFKVYKDLTERSIRSVKSKLDSERKYRQGYLGDIAYKEKYEKLVDSFETKHVTDMKRLPIPFCAVENGEFNFKGSISANTSIGELWCSIKDSYSVPSFSKNYSDYEEIVVEPSQEVELRMSKEHRAQLLGSNRVRVSLSHAGKLDLSESGYLGKKLKKVQKPVNTQTSLGYSLTKDYDFTDFDRFITSSDLFAEHEPSEKWDKITGLLSTGGFDLTDPSSKFFRRFCSTRLGGACEFLSSLFSELNLNYRKPTKSNEFIVNVIPNYKALLAIKNTGSSKHSFYTVLVLKSDLHEFSCSRLFRRWVDVGDYYALELSSTRRHDISNYLFCTSKIISMLSTHMEVFGEKLEMKRNIECSQEFLFHLLVYLSNNNQVSECLQQVRFFYMKTNSSKQMPENLLSPVEKLPDIIRSRFCCYAIRKLLSAFIGMSATRDRISHIVEEKEDSYEEENFSEDFLNGVSSYISGRRLKNYEEALLLSYGGIYHNKEKSDPVTSNLQIYRKLTREELKLKNASPDKLKNGYNISDSMKMPPHGFSGIHLRNCGLALKDDMKMRGLNFSDLQQRIAIALDRVTFEELATFKASLEANHLHEDDSDEVYNGKYKDLKFDSACKDGRGKYKYGKTCRALEGVLDLLKSIHTDENVRPFHVITTLINLCNQRGGIVAILFKKAQFGSVREIFILTMFARVVVKFAETVARTIADCCPNEFLTKGSSKINSTPNHYSKIRSARSPGDTTLSMFDSLDCQTWCQNFTFPAFGNLFSVVFREWPEMSNMLRNIFNMASSKRHEMTEGLMSLFIKHQEIDSTAESMNVLKSEFLSKEPGMLNNGEQSIFVNNVSNFMQGIFHYTSTVLHSSHLIMMTKVIKMYLRKNETQIRSFIHTTKASSDDGSSLMSVIVKDTASKDDLLRIRGKLFVASEMLVRSYPLACAWIGEPKSTRFVENGVEEFNSLWSFRNTVLSVPSKFTTAAVCAKITRSTIERQRVDHNSLSSCIENGSSMRLTKIIELACALNHYTILGLDSLSSKIWVGLVKNIQQVPHPAAWLYISTPRLAGPTLGFDATLYNFLKSNSLSRRVQYVVKEMLAGSFDTKSGFLVQSSIVVGALTKYNEFLKRVVDESEFDSLVKRIGENPEIMYRPSTDISEVKTKILMKAKSPGAERAFIFEDESSIHSISSYLVTSPCLSVSKKVEREGDWVRKKMTLPAYLRMLQEMCSDKESMSSIEPHSETLLDMLGHYSDVLLPIGRRRKTPVKVRFPKTRSETEISLLSAAKFIWFSVFNRYDENQNMECFKEYQKTHTWLGDTYDQTVKNMSTLGVEGNVHSVIYGMLMTETDLDRTVSFMHAGKKQSTIISSYLSCIEYCQEKDSRLVRPKDIYSRTDLGNFLEVERDLFPYVSIHPKIRQLVNKDKTDSLEKCAEIFEENKELFLRKRSEREVRFLPARLKSLLTIGTAELMKDNKEEIENVLMNYSTGFIISYVKPQRKVIDENNHTKWLGEGIFFVNSKFAKFLIKCTDDMVTEVSSTEPLKITQHMNLLSRIFRTLRLRRDAGTAIKSEGVKISGKHAYYTTTLGTPVRQMTYTEDMRDVKYETELVINRAMQLELKIWVSNRRGRLKAESVYFKPANSGNGDCSYKLTPGRAMLVLNTVVAHEETNSVRNFCQDSLKDRFNRLNLAPRKKTRDLYNVPPREDFLFDEEELLRDIQDEFDFAQDMSDDEFVRLLGPMEEIEGFEDVVGELEFSSADMDALVDEVDLYSVVKTIDSQGTSFEDLVLWDELINNFKEMTTLSIQQVLEGNYYMVEEPTVKRFLESLIELGVIERPMKKLAYEEDEDEEDLSDWCI